MDLLSQYKEQHPEAFQERKEKPPPMEEGEYGLFVRLVIRASGGRLNARQANYILLIGTVIVLIWVAYYFFGPNRSSAPQPRPVPPGGSHL